MKLKLVTAATLLAVMPALAQPLPPLGGPQQRMAPRPAPAPQQQQAPRPTEAQVQQVVQTVSADRAKLFAYCRLAKIQQQMGTVDEKKNPKKMQVLGQQAGAEAQKIGPEFERVMAGLEQIDENSAEGRRFGAILANLDSKCPNQQAALAQPLPPPGGPQNLAPLPAPQHAQLAQPLPPPGGPQRVAPPPAPAPQQRQAQPLPPPGGPQQRMAPPPGPAPQQQQAPKPTEAQVQKVVQTVSADRAKLDAYCRLGNLQQQMGTLDEKKDAAKLQALGQQADAEAQKLGPDFARVMDGLEQVDENSAEGKRFAAILATLDSKCGAQQAQPLPPPGGPQQRMAPPPAPQQQQGQPRPQPGPAPQQQQAPKPTEAQVQKVVQTVSADKAKVDAYCKIMQLQQQMSTLDQNKDAAKLQALGQQADAEAQKLGPDFEKMMDGLEQIDENSAEGKKFAAILGGLDSKCK